MGKPEKVRGSSDLSAGLTSTQEKGKEGRHSNEALSRLEGSP